MVIYRFKQLKEGEKKNKLTKALPVEDVQPLASVSASDDGSDIESDNKVFHLWSLLTWFWYCAGIFINSILYKEQCLTILDFQFFLRWNILFIFLHVWKNNSPAIDWSLKFSLPISILYCTWSVFSLFAYWFCCIYKVTVMLTKESKVSHLMGLLPNFLAGRV